MSTLPEAKLAAEAEIAYQVILMSTDYDVRTIPPALVGVNMSTPFLLESYLYHYASTHAT